MSVAGPVQHVVDMLHEAGYEAIKQPHQIGGIPFDFAAMLAGHDSLDVVVLVDLVFETDDECIRRRVLSLARALDLVRSRRSLTAILLGPRRGAGLIQAISGVARVLSTGSVGEGEEADLRDALAVLLPFKVATETHNAADPWASVRERMTTQHPAEIGPILLAARIDSAQVNVAGRRGLGVERAARIPSVRVTNALHKLLTEPIDDFTRAQDRKLNK